MTINITERKLTEEESKFSEEQFRTLAFGTSQIIWVIGPNGRVSREQSNPSWERFTGQKKEETLDLGMLNAMHPEDRERVKQIWLKAVNSRTTYQAEYRLRRYDGEYRWVAAKGAPIINSDGSVREWFGTSTDITDQKNAEMAARESEIKFQNLWESNWDAQILCFPPEWKLIGGNAAAVKLFGAENTTDLATLTPNDLSPERQPDGELSATKAPKMIEKALRDGASLFEWTHQLRDGQVLTCEVQLTRITVNGQTGVQATVRDVTKRKEAEKKLQDSEERFRTLALSSSHIVWSCGPDGKVGREHFNETWQKFTGANVEDYLGIGWLQWMHPDDHHHMMQKWTHAVETKTPFEDEYRLRRYDGVYVWMLGKGVPLLNSDGSVKGWFGTLTDISERKNTEEKLRLSEERFRTLAFASSQIVWSYGADGRVRSEHSINSWERYTGQNSEESFGLGWLNAIHPEDRENTLKNWEEASKKKETYINEYRIRKYDGEYRWFEGKAVPLLNFDGTIQEWFGTCTDITEQKRFAETLVQTRKLEALGQLTGGIAHDFNNLLMIVLGNLELAETSNSIEKIRNLIQKVINVVQKASIHNQRLLTFARKGSLKTEKLNVNKNITEMQKMLERSLGEGMTIITDLDPHLAETEVDPSELDNSIINIAINARDAMKEGGTLKITTRNITLNEKAAQKHNIKPGEYVRMTLSDTGHGMTPEVVRRSIEPFFTTKDVGKGTGLGLSSVYGFLRQSGGFLDIQSEPEKGTSVNFYLPQAESEKKLKTKEFANDDVPMGNGEVILVVEDNENVREVTLSRLETLGYAVLEARTGPEAIELMKSDTPIDLVFSDVTMPNGISGYDVVRWVKEKKPEIKVLLNSGNDQPELRKKSEVCDVKLLLKPYTRSELGKAVREVLTG